MATANCKDGFIITDKCMFCIGYKGGVPGNENRIGDVVMCDYCHALVMECQRIECEKFADVLHKLSVWVRAPGNIHTDDAIDECARLLENNSLAYRK